MSTAEVLSLVDYRERNMSNSKQGHFDIYRSLLEVDWADNTGKLSCWVRLVGQAAYKSITVNFNHREWKLEAGQLVIRIDDLASKLRDNDNKPMSRDAVNRILKFFKSKGMISIEGTRFGTLITILNYGKYQNCATAHITAHNSAQINTSDSNALNGDGAHNCAHNTALYEQEVNNNNNIYTSSEDDLPVFKIKKSKIDFNLVMEAYNDAVEGKLPTIRKMDQTRINAVKKLLRTFDDPSFQALANYFYDFVDTAKPYYFGDNKTNWKADFDYIVRPKTYLKTIEGSL